MKLNSYKCDRCGKIYGEHSANSYGHTLEICVGQTSEGSGSTEDVTERVDLCFNCILSVLENFITDMSHETRKSFVKMLKRKHPMIEPRD